MANKHMKKFITLDHQRKTSKKYMEIAFHSSQRLHGEKKNSSKFFWGAGNKIALTELPA